MRVKNIYLPQILEEETNAAICWAIVEILRTAAQSA